MEKEKFFITTAIYYINDKPHIGSVSEVIAADIIARFKRSINKDTFFSTGTDEHSQKVEKIAILQNKNVKIYVDEAAEIWKKIFEKLEVSFDSFIRTSNEEHKRVVQWAFNELYKKGDIYKGLYEGWYCIRDETFLLDGDLINLKCPHCGGEVQKVKEENYFFRLSKYEKLLLEHYEKNLDFIEPKIRYNELLNVLKGGLKDISVSRSSLKWGIPLPFDSSQTIYVWFDALLNYISVIDFNSNEKKFKKYWPADIHLIGKDITRFHGIVWPAMLMSLGLELPKKIFAHGFWNFEGVRMSKSLGNIVDPEDVISNLSKKLEIEEYKAVELLRYYLSREVTYGLDGNFSISSLIGRYNSDLVNDLGNLLNRTAIMAIKYFNGEIKKPLKIDTEFKELFEAKKREIEEEYSKLSFSTALEKIWSLLSFVNTYIERSKPWEIYKEGKLEELNLFLYNCLEGIRWIAHLLEPVMPKTSLTILDAIDENKATINDLKWLKGKNIIKIKEPQVLFPRFKGELEDVPSKPEDKKPEEKENYVTYEEFSKLKFKVAKVKNAEKVEGKDKLLKLTVSLGDEVRTIVAGIAKHYTPSDLIGKNIIILSNLEPKRLAGIESKGMLLAASDESFLSILTTDKDIEEGADVH